MSEKYDDVSLFTILGKYMGRQRRMFSIVVVMMLLSVIISNISPLILNLLLQNVELHIAKLDTGTSILLIAYVALSLLAWVIGAIQFVAFSKLNARFIHDLRNDAYASLIENKVSFFDMQKTGDLTSRIVIDTRELKQSGQDIAWTITNFTRLLVIIGIYYYFSIGLASVAMLIMPVILGLTYVMGKLERKVSDVWRHKFGEVNARFAEIMSKIQISKTFNREDENLRKFKIINEETYQASVKRGLIIFLFWPMTDLLKHSLLLVILWFGVQQVGLGMPLSTLILFLILLNSFYWPLISIAENYPRFQMAFSSLHRIAHYSWNTEYAELPSGTLTKDHLDGHIEFLDMSFAYTDTPVLQSIDLDLPAGQRTALVGHTGAGKSTIAALLIRFYDITTGKLLLDGHPIQDYDIKWLRKHVGLVSQRVLLFKGTVRENLLVANPSASDGDIWHVLEMVQAKEFIMLLPKQLDAEVTEGGSNLSAGQRQMIAFARVLLAPDCDIIILDEASSAVDLYVESKIQEAIDVILKSRTSISIAHRLTTIVKADAIVVIKDGRIMEVGSHEQLMDKASEYSDMYHLYLETQSAKYLETIKR